MALLASATEQGFGFGLLLTAFWFGFRHGIDWDHIAAITDITSSQEDRRRSIWYGTLYVLGHAAVVLVLGVLAILAGDRLPESVDDVMGRVVGVTLILLGVYVFVSLVQHGRDFRLRSRWMLLFTGIRRGARWVREHATSNGRLALLEQDEEIGGDPTRWHHGHHGRPGHHHHRGGDQHEAMMNYGRGTAFSVGMLHGVGAETPTQVLIFLAAAGAGGVAAGIAVLVVFLVGLVAANSVITVGSVAGFLSATRNFGVYAAVAVITGIFSLAIGGLFVLGLDSVLPAFFSG